MSNEPERPIEKALRACARKRRADAGAPLELHPATRRLLQGEVARQFAQDHRQPRTLSERLARLWPRFAWGVVILAGLTVAVSLWLPGWNKAKNEFTLAKNDEAPAAHTVNGARPLPAPSPAKAPARLDRPEVPTITTIAPDALNLKEEAKNAPVGGTAPEPSAPSGSAASARTYGLAATPS